MTGVPAAAAIFALPTELLAVPRQARLELATEGSVTYATGQGGRMHCPIESMPGNKRKEFGLGAFTSRRLVF
jgi:hypothetical protein